MKAGYKKSAALGELPRAELLSEKIYNALKQEIITCALEPGTSVTEAYLIKKFGVSRTPIREVCSRLEKEGLMKSVPYKGFFVSDITLKDVQELYQVRWILERAAAEIAAQQQEASLLRRIEELIKIKFTPGDAESYNKFIRVDTELHTLIAKMTGNERLVAMISEILSARERVLYYSLYKGEHGALTNTEHQRIYEAIKNRNADLAREAMGQHVEAAKKRILKAVFKIE